MNKTIVTDLRRNGCFSTPTLYLYRSVKDSWQNNKMPIEGLFIKHLTGSLGANQMAKWKSEETSPLSLSHSLLHFLCIVILN